VTTAAAATEQGLCTSEELLQRWERVLQDPLLRELPYRLELNKWGYIEMTPPASPRHMDLAATLLRLLSDMLGGRALPECSMMVTGGGVRVADVVWCSQAFLERNAREFATWAAALRQAPEICVEIKSPTNSIGELREKLSLYLAAGAREGWIVHPDGRVDIWEQAGERATSSFPVNLAHIRDALTGPLC
jgi:Uma2 family endonuclease